MPPNGRIVSLEVKDIRFPTSLEGDGSDPMHPDPDYSCCYVIVTTDQQQRGHGHTFTIGRGTDIVCYAVRSYRHLVVGKGLDEIYADFDTFLRTLTSESQLRWLGPEKGVVHLAVAAIMNALWDLWARIEGKPVWKLLVDMEPETLLNTVDFRYLSDALTKEEALDMLKKMRKGKAAREKYLLEQGFPAYITSVGWSGYDEDKIRKLCRESLAAGWTRFKMKVGITVEDDRRRAAVIREEVGMDKPLMMDCNQRWEVAEAVDWMTQLAEYKPVWIEEPTSPDDVMGHAAIREALAPLGIGVATGECCSNRVMFKQFLKAGGMSFCQVDACRLGSLNEIIPILLMAAKYGVPVCPHAGGIGLCELVQHICIFDYIAVSGSLENRMTEYADHLHEHMVYPAFVSKGHYQPPMDPGYSSEIKEDSVADYQYPDGNMWRQLFVEGKFTRPDDA